MSRIDAVSFDTTGFHVHQESADERIWLADDGQPIKVYIRPGPSTLLVMLRQPNAVAGFREAIARMGMGLVELGSLQFDGWVVVRTITKSAVPPESGHGRRYLGMLTIPFREWSVVISTEAHEHLTSGVRESEVFAMLEAKRAFRLRDSATTRVLEDGTIVIAREDMEGWLSDPTDPAPPHLARCVADDPEYDAWIPEHPLSRVRSLLDRIQQSIRVAADASPVASFASDAPPKRWWQWWL